jgi:hypothetical protein
MDELESIFRNSSKKDLLDDFSESLPDYDKVIIVMVKDGEEGKYTSRIMLMGFERQYESVGILENAKHDLFDVDDT